LINQYFHPQCALKGDQQETGRTEDSISELPESERIAEEKKGEISRLQMSQLRLEYRLKTAQNEAIDLKKQLLTMDNRITTISRDLQQLHAEKEGLHTDLQRHERDINQNLIGSSSRSDTAEQKVCWGTITHACESYKLAMLVLRTLVAE